VSEGGAKEIVSVTVLEVLRRDPAVVLADEALSELGLTVVEVFADAVADALNKRSSTSSTFMRAT
jgi:hypothetical protein